MRLLGLGDVQPPDARLDIPRQRQTRRLPISQHRRLALLNRFLTDQRIPLRTRVAACLLLLYAQPVARLVRLTIDDVIDHDGQVFIRLGAPRARSPNPLPPWSSHAPSATVPGTTTCHVIAVGGTWHRYPAHPHRELSAAHRL